MAKRETNRLKALTVARLKEPGYHADGAGLYLQVTPSGSKSWVFRFTLAGKAREMGLGSLLAVSIADARAKAEKARAMLANGLDPLEAKRAEAAARALATATARTFADCATQYIEAHRAGWKNAKHASQWAATLKTYALPVLGDLPVSKVDTGLVLQVLEPIWKTKTETASRVRGRIESVLSWATVRGFRSGENPARWRGHLDALLAEPAKVAKVRHHPALPVDQLPQFMPALRAIQGVSPLALEFLILTAARTNEVLGARWEEIDLGARVWSVPGTRMKAGKEHRIPLSMRAIAILEVMKHIRVSDFVFPGQRGDRPLSNMALLMLLKGMGKADITAHGFRSTFRDWAAEQTNFPNHVLEMALAHSIKDKAEAAYRRGDLFAKREKLMQSWADYCDNFPAKIVHMNRMKR